MRRRTGYTSFVAAIAALVAVAALGASTAAANSPGIFEAEAYPVTIKASQTVKHVFKVNSGSTECTAAEFEGTAAAASGELNVMAKYTGCTAFGGAATVEMRGCEYKFHAGNETAVNVHAGTVDVVSKAGKNCATEPIRVQAATCTVTVGPQNGLGALTFTNLNPGQFGLGGPPFAEVEVGINVSGITYTEAVGCLVPGTHNNGTYTGKALVKGFNGGGGQIGVRVK